MNKGLFIYVILVAALMLPSLLMAQVAPPDDPNDTFVPIDGGLALLLAAGVGYGAKKLIQHRDKYYEEE
jgi:hypothetical protein